jgi:hypothetical protein
MTKPAFRPIAAPLEVDDEALGRVADQMGVPTMVKPSPPPLPEGGQTTQDEPIQAERTPAAQPASSAPRARKPDPPSIPRLKALEKLTVEVPAYLIDAVKREALDQRTSARHVLMLALRRAGFKIDDADMVPDGRRTRRKSANT